MRRELREVLCEKTVGRIPLLNSIPSRRFRHALNDLLTPLLYEKGDTVLSKGQPTEEIYFLRHGQVDVCAAFDGRVLFPIADAGAYFGEVTLMGLSPQFTYTASIWTEVFYIQGATLAQHARETLAPMLITDLLSQVREEAIRKMCLRCWMLRALGAESTTRRLEQRMALRLQYQYATHAVRKRKKLSNERLFPFFYDSATEDGEGGDVGDGGDGGELAEQEDSVSPSPTPSFLRRRSSAQVLDMRVKPSAGSTHGASSTLQISPRPSAALQSALLLPTLRERRLARGSRDSRESRDSSDSRDDDDADLPASPQPSSEKDRLQQLEAQVAGMQSQLALLIGRLDQRPYAPAPAPLADDRSRRVRSSSLLALLSPRGRHPSSAASGGGGGD